MRGSVVLPALLLVVLTAFGGAAPALVGAQEGQTPGAGRITYVRLDAPDADQRFGDKLELYRFRFARSTDDQPTLLPESDPFSPEQGEVPTISREAMMVFVDAGPFVLYTPPTMEPGAVVVVSGDGLPIEYEQWLDSTTPAPEGRQPCPSPCSVPPDRYAYVETGDYVFHRKNSGCPYCNENMDAEGVLFVSPLTPADGDFSWTQAANVELATPEAATPEAARRAWRMNPGPPCGGKYS